MATGRVNTWAPPRARGEKSNEHKGRRGNGGKPAIYEQGQDRPYPTVHLPGRFKVTKPAKLLKHVARRGR